jgi:hypothetical protein
MASVTFKRGTSVAGTTYSPAEVASFSLAVAKTLIGEGAAKFTNAAVTKPLPNNREGVTYIEDVTALTGDAPVGLNGYLVEGIPARRMFECVITGETRPRRYMVITKDGETADADSVIEPPDFDADANNKLLLRVQ